MITQLMIAWLRDAWLDPKEYARRWWSVQVYGDAQIPDAFRSQFKQES